MGISIDMINGSFLVLGACQY